MKQVLTKPTERVLTYDSSSAAAANATAAANEEYARLFLDDETALLEDDDPQSSCPRKTARQTSISLSRKKNDPFSPDCAANFEET